VFIEGKKACQECYRSQNEGENGVYGSVLNST